MTMPQRTHAQLPLDIAAESAIAGAQRMLGGNSFPRLPLTQQEKQEARKVVQDGGVCLFCGGVHVGASTPACPRLASGKLNGDGAVVEFAYWQEWNTDRVVFPEDIEEDEESNDG